MGKLMPAKLERLYDVHAQALFAFLRNLTRDEADTRDLLQALKRGEKPKVGSQTGRNRSEPFGQKGNATA
mgnify:CR=1 FL=1